MGLGSMICPHCNRQMNFNTDNPLKFCLYCGKEISVQSQQSSAPRNGVEMLEISPREYEGTQSNTEFINDKNEKILNGWLPEGYVTKAEVESNKGDLDCPLAMWARAKKSDGTEWFCRRYKRIKIDKIKEPDRFLEYEKYLDKQAAVILGTDSLRLIMRVPADDGDLEEICEKLRKHKESLENLPMGGSVRYVVQGEYGALGGKLYEATVNGRKKYLFLHTYMLADEHGVYSPMLNSMRSTGGFMGAFGQFQQSSAPVIDTNPNTPFGMHRTDGLTSNTIYWNIVSFGGIISNICPQRSDICDFLRFTHSLSVHPELQAVIQKFQQQMVSQEIMTQQQLANTLHQGALQRQREMDRHNAVMSGIRADMDNIQQQMINSSNAAFDRSVRKNHEMVMGVNTYERTNGTTFEADVRYDRVFQRDNDPSMLMGASNTADVPIGWTELHKLD